MDRNRLINLGIIGAIVLVGLFGWVLGVSPVLDQTAAAKTQQSATATANGASEARLATMKKQFADLPKLQTELDGLRLSIPNGADVPQYLASINAFTASTGASLVSLTVANALAYVDPSAAAATAAAATTTSTATPTPTPSPSASAATTGTAAADPTAPVATGPTAGLVSVPVTVVVSGSYDQMMTFANDIQVDTRLFFVTSTKLGFDPVKYLFTLTLDGSIYTLPAPATAATTTSTPTQTPAPSTTPTPSSTVSAKPSGTPTSTPTPTGTAKP